MKKIRVLKQNKRTNKNTNNYQRHVDSFKDVNRRSKKQEKIHWSVIHFRSNHITRKQVEKSVPFNKNQNKKQTFFYSLFLHKDTHDRNDEQEHSERAWPPEMTNVANPRKKHKQRRQNENPSVSGHCRNKLIQHSGNKQRVHYVSPNLRSNNRQICKKYTSCTKF